MRARRGPVFEVCGVGTSVYNTYNTAVLGKRLQKFCLIYL